MLPLVVLALLLGGASTASALAQSSAPRTWADTVALDRDGSVEIDTHSGSVDVRTWDRARVGYEVTLEPSETDSTISSPPPITRGSSSLTFGGDSWSFSIPGLITISPSGTGQPIAHYRMKVPSTADLDIEDHDSVVDVTGLEADVGIDTYAGDVSLTDVKGSLELETYSGPIVATGLEGDVDIETYSGPITASIDQLTQASTIETYSGRVQLYLPKDMGFVLIRDVPTEELHVDDAFGSPTKEDDRWTFNGGGPELEIDSYSGAVTIRPLGARND